MQVQANTENSRPLTSKTPMEMLGIITNQTTPFPVLLSLTLKIVHTFL